jgi:signal transduction histidine kinase
VRERVTLAELVQDAVRLFGDSFSRHHIEFEIVDPEEGLSAILDKHRVLQIVINLLKNARDALKQSDAEPRRITVEMDRDEKQRTRIRVRDNGVGIPPGKLERIFNYGFTTKEEGHGYGLHGSANAAREMGGRLTAASEGEGRGACFTLLLPPEAGRRT